MCIRDRYKKRYRKMQAALNDGKGGQRTDISASVAAREILDVQQQIIASSVKTAKMLSLIHIWWPTCSQRHHATH